MRDVNRVVCTGRAVKDPDVKYTTGDKPMCISRFSLAVGRKFKNDEADFINFVAFGKSAEGIEKFVKKGTKLAIEGHIQTGSYTNKDGNKVYTTEVVVDDWCFCESKAAQAQTAPQASAPAQAQTANDFMNIPDALSDSLPFA